MRSTVATYANVHDELRKVFAQTPAAKAKKYKAGDFSYNTGSLRCPTCDGAGRVPSDRRGRSAESARVSFSFSHTCAHGRMRGIVKNPEPSGAGMRLE